ncbi:MAG TPA: GerMN domain-containing protein [Terracidiphilus sp.]|nr:GerMN domain-containing protein [Terracidiphilus sp.]
MIPRHQTILFIVLFAASAIMGFLLWNQLRRAHDRLLRGEDSAPTHAPQVAPAEQATLMVANDADNTVQPRVLTLPLPQNPEARARAILGKLLDLYADPESTHPVPGGAGGIAEVFLMPVPDATGASDAPQLAVVNLAGAFVAAHPSGLETESLTVLSICETLHANLPGVTEVRFLVDGQTRARLAGHADLSRTYLTNEDAAMTPDARP